MKKKKKISKKKVTRFVVFILVLVFVIVGVVLTSKNLFKKENKNKQVVKVVETIENYDYTLDDNETEYYKGLFRKLKEALEVEEIDEEKYASLVGQLFLSDFFTLDNKLNKNDIGGLQFVYNDFQTDFEMLAKNSIYHVVENNIYGDREQILPVVTKVSVGEVEKVPYTYLDTNDEEAYQIDFDIEYEEDLGYQVTTTLVLIHHDDKLEIIKMLEE